MQKRGDLKSHCDFSRRVSETLKEFGKRKLERREMDGSVFMEGKHSLAPFFVSIFSVNSEKKLSVLDIWAFFFCLEVGSCSVDISLFNCSYLPK